MSLTLKSRKFRPLSLIGRYWQFLDSYYISGQHFAQDICEHQMTWSEGNPWPKGRGYTDTGGPFETIRTRYNANYDISKIVQFGATPGSWIRGYEGNFLPQASGGYILSPSATEDNLRQFCPSLGDVAIGGMGSRAISAVAPTSPMADVGVTLAELYREGIPTLLGSQLYKVRRNSAKDQIKAGSGEFLNYTFGYAPLIAAIRDTAKAVMTADSHVAQLLRDSGKNVRREYRYPVDRTITRDVKSITHMPWPGLNPYYWDQPSALPVEHTTTERSVWFSGCFTYYIDPTVLQGLRGHAEKARLLYGLTINPSVVWNLLPWSWLIDWMMTVGPVMDNISTFSRDGLTLRYGYTMEKIQVTQEISHPGLISQYGTLPRSPTLVLRGERKIRRPQTPFSLGLVGGDFSLRQAAILTALGINRTL